MKGRKFYRQPFIIRLKFIPAVAAATGAPMPVCLSSIELQREWSTRGRSFLDFYTRAMSMDKWEERQKAGASHNYELGQHSGFFTEGVWHQISVIHMEALRSPDELARWRALLLTTMLETQWGTTSLPVWVIVHALLATFKDMCRQSGVFLINSLNMISYAILMQAALNPFSPREQQVADSHGERWRASAFVLSGAF
eukprot:235268-Pelagomonas_calceolata.AAC.3